VARVQLGGEAGVEQDQIGRGAALQDCRDGKQHLCGAFLRGGDEAVFSLLAGFDGGF